MCLFARFDLFINVDCICAKSLKCQKPGGTSQKPDCKDDSMEWNFLEEQIIFLKFFYRGCVDKSNAIIFIRWKALLSTQMKVEVDS